MLTKTSVGYRVTERAAIVMELNDSKTAGHSKSSKAESDDDSSAEPQPKKCKTDMEWQFFVSEATQLDFVEQINRTNCCSTPDCRGKISIPNLLSL